MKKRFLAALVCAMLLLTLLPTTAFAAGTGAIQLGAGGIVKDNKVYFGKKGTTIVPWIAIDSSGFLLSEYTIDTSRFRFDKDYGSYAYELNNTTESNSKLKEAMERLYSSSRTALFSDAERGAIKQTILEGSSMYDIHTPDVDAYLFSLSFSEAQSKIGWGNDLLKAKSIDAPEGGAVAWWLRSKPFITHLATYVNAEGNYSNDSIYEIHGVRPAFQLNLNAVLFISAAVGGKSASGMGSVLTPVSGTTPTEWKLTLLDGDRHFAAATTAVNGNALTISYTNATTGSNEHISAIVKDSSDNINYYGRIAQPAAADGTVTIDLSGIDMTGKTLYVFSEQYNGGANDDTKLTDYASALIEVAQTISLSASIGNVTVPGTTGTAITPADATITLTNEKFNALAADADVSGWFTNLPAGLAAKIKTAVLANETTATVTFTGTPTAESTAAMTVTIPAASLAGNAALTVTANANAKWAIDPAPSTSGGGSSSISGGGVDTGSQYVGTWNANVLTVQAPCDKFISVTVDGVQLKENTDYTKKCGSTIITFTPSCLATLANGTHTIRVQFTDGRYDGNFVTPFTASLATLSIADVPATGEPAAGWALLVLSLFTIHYSIFSIHSKKLRVK